MEGEAMPPQPAQPVNPRPGTRHRHGPHSRRKQLQKLAQQLAVAAFVLLVVLAAFYVWMASLRE